MARQKKTSDENGIDSEQSGAEGAASIENTESAVPEANASETGVPEAHASESGAPEAHASESAATPEAEASKPEPLAASPDESASAEAPAPRISGPESASPYYASDHTHEPLTPPKASGGGAAWAALLLVVLGGVGSSPFWAPSLAPLLPWTKAIETAVGPDPALRQDVSSLALRVAALEQGSSTGMGASTGMGTGMGGADLSSLQDTLRQQATTIRDLTDRVSSVEQRPADTTSGGAPASTSASVTSSVQDELKRLADRANTLERKLASVEAQANSQAAASQASPMAPVVPPGLMDDTRRLGTDLSALKERVGKLENAPGTGGGIGARDVGLLLSLGQLRGAIDSGRPFAGPLANVKDAEAAALLAPLGHSAASGIPTVTLLRQGFESVGNAVVQAAATVPASDQLGDVVVSKLRSLVTIRRTGAGGSGPAPGADGIVATAETALAANDLAGAVAALEKLPEPAAKPAASWLDQARARVQADAALAAAENTLTARFGGAAGNEAAH